MWDEGEGCYGLTGRGESRWQRDSSAALRSGCNVGGGIRFGRFVIFCGGNEGWVGAGSGDFSLGYGSRGGSLEARKCWHSREEDGSPHARGQGHPPYRRRRAKAWVPAFARTRGGSVGGQPRRRARTWSGACKRAAVCPRVSSTAFTRGSTPKRSPSGCIISRKVGAAPG